VLLVTILIKIINAGFAVYIASFVEDKAQHLAHNAYQGIIHKMEFASLANSIAQYVQVKVIALHVSPDTYIIQLLKNVLLARLLV